MPDWNKEVRSQIESLDLPPDTKEEVIAELASHLEDAESQRSPQSLAQPEIRSKIEWRKLSRAIGRAKREEVWMNRRTKALWLPSVTNIAVSVMVVVTLDCLNLGEPGIVTLGHTGKAFRLPWLLAVPFLGALGALLAKRAHASVAQRLIAGLAPSLVWFGVLATLGMALVLSPSNFGGVSLKYFALSFLGLVIIPLVGSLLGTLPFLADSHPRQYE